MARSPKDNLNHPLVDVKQGLVSRELFVNEELYQQEQEQLFAHCWLFVGHESQIPKPGDYFVSGMGEESVILTRDREHYSLRYSGPAGMTEQDDMENWNYATLASKGVIARRYPYNYQMGLGQDYGTYDSPGVLTDRIAEQNQRGFYERWAAYNYGARTDPRNGRRESAR